MDVKREGEGEGEGAEDVVVTEFVFIFWLLRSLLRLVAITLLCTRILYFGIVLLDLLFGISIHERTKER